MSIEKCTSRSPELKGIGIIPQCQPDTKGFFRMVKVQADSEEDVSTDHKLKHAMQRRGIALDIGGALAYEVHDLLVEAYFDALQVSPPEGYSQIDHGQVMRQT